jgi:hypothetical protein
LNLWPIPSQQPHPPSTGVTVMKRPVKQLLFWLPRVLTILFALFLSVFALDVFDEGYEFWGTVVALFMHLIPTWIVLVVLAVSWRWEWVGAVLFVALGLLYAYFALGRGHPDWIVVISGPLFVVGVLFLLSWLYRGQIRATA